MTNVAKTIKYMAMALAIFLAVSIISGICYGVNLLSDTINNEEVRDSDVKNTLQLPSAKIMSRMNIDVKRVNIYIKVDSDFGISTTNKYIKSKIDNDILYIYEDNHSMLDKYAGDLYIFIPQDYVFSDIDIENGVGMLEIDTMKTSKLSLDLGAGKAILKNIDVSSEMDIEGGAGTIEIIDSTISGLDLDMGAGKVMFSGYLRGDNKIDAGLGSLVINLYDDEYTVSIDKGIGNAKYNGEEMKDDSLYGIGRNRISLNGGIGSIKINTKKIVSVS